MAKNKNKAEVFTFGDPIPVLDGRDLCSYAETWYNGEYYEMPISANGLAKSLNANVHHKSAIDIKVNKLVASFKPNKYFSSHEFRRYAFEFIVFGNAYIERINNSLGQLLKLKTSLSKFTRRGKEGSYFFLNGYSNKHEFKQDSIFHLMEIDINQEMYGVPSYLPALNSAWLNESATLFRRKYYENGSHAGFILYMTDTAHKDEDIDNIRNALKDAKGPGNFRNLFMYAPNGQKDGLQLIPIADVSAKDEFYHVKDITMTDVLAMHRVPPQVMAIVPKNTGGFGNASEANEIFEINELDPLRARLSEINDWVDKEVVTFYQRDETKAS